MKVDSKIKVTYLFDKYPTFYQPYIDSLIEELSKKEEIELAIKAFEKGDVRKKTVTIFPSYKKRKAYEKILHIIGKYEGLSYTEYQVFKEDVVHIQHSYLFPKLFRLLKIHQNKRPKIVITLRGGDTYVKPWLYRKWSDFYTHYGNQIDAFITMSEHQKNYLHTKWGIDKERIHVIPISFGSKHKIEPKMPNKTKINIVSIFRMCWEKNIDGNLRAIKNLHDKGLSVEYNIYGDGPDTGQLLYLIDKYNLHNCVNYHGKVANSILKKHIIKYDFLLQLSHSEAFPTTVLEAQSVGIPVVVADSGGLPEAIISNKTGFCVEANDSIKAADHIESLWKQAELYKSFSTEAIKFAQSNFATENEVEKLTNLYLKLK